jgi:drug/metabolite transporter (DMT)-like permease
LINVNCRKPFRNFMNHPSNLRGIGFMLLAGFVFMLNDSFLKIILADLPPYEVLVMRGVFGTLIAGAFLTVMGELKQWRAALNRFVFLRAGFETAAILTYILALARAPIGDVTAIFQTTPLLVILGMVLIHREQASGLRLGLVVAGFAGAMLVAQPGQGTTSPFVMLAFVTAVFAALRDLAGRYIPRTVSPMLSTFVTIVVVCASSAVCGLLFETWTAPKASAWGLSIGAGLFVMLGHFFTLLAYKNASAQAVAPFYYSFMVFAVVMGFVIFGDVPNLLAFSGMAIIMGSGLAIGALERKRSGAAD